MTTQKSALWTNRDWQKLWLGETVSGLGDYVFDVTLVLWVGTVITRGQSYAPLAVSGVLIAAAVPTVLIGPVAGVFVDRWNRKRTMMNADLIRAVVIGLLIILPSVQNSLPRWTQLAAIYSAVAVAAAVAQFFNPSRFATVGAIVAPEDRARAFGLTSATSNAVAVLGPPLAAPLLFSIGVQFALAINSLSFLASYILVRLTAIPADIASEETQAPNFRREILEGWRFIRGNRVLMTIAIAVFIYMFGVGAINVLEVFFVSQNLHVAASWLGTLNGSLGVGSIIGAIIAARLVKKVNARTVFAWGIVATALLVLVFAVSSSLLMAVVVLGLIGVPLALVNTVLSPIILEETPNRLLGRINAVLNPLVYLASVTSMAIAGVVASWLPVTYGWSLLGLRFNRISTIFAVCAGIMILAGITAAVRLQAGPRTEPEDAKEIAPTVAADS